MTSMVSYAIDTISADFLQQVRERGFDDQQQPVVRSIARGGEPLRDLLRRARPGEEIILASYCPFDRPGPFREFGPIFVSVQGDERDEEDIFSRRADPSLDYFQRQLTLRAYNHQGAIADAAIIDFDFAETQLAEFLGRAEVDFVDARFPSYGCFAARFRRA